MSKYNRLIQTIEEATKGIAASYTSFKTLAPANTNSEDFTEISKWQLKTMLDEAYKAGYTAAENEKA